MANRAIWADYYANIGTTSGTAYTIKKNGTAIYNGTAYIRPGESVAYCRMNDICGSYLFNELPADITTEGFNTVNTLWLTFDLYLGATLRDTVAFYYNWNYGDSYTSSPPYPSYPITGRQTTIMPIIMTTYNAGSCYLKEDDGTLLYTITAGGAGNAVFIPDDHGADIGDTLKTWRGTTGYGTYHMVSGCGCKYALYYVNAAGGWDALLIEGAVRQTDTYTRHEKRVEYNNATLSNRGLDNYANEIVRSWEMHTGYLTDDQASRMHHLLGSTLVYLVDLEALADGDYCVHPVVIKNADCPYKKFKDEGRFVDYALEVELARDIIRR